MDDGKREDETGNYCRWLLENPEFCASHLETKKGMCILKQKI